MRARTGLVGLVAALLTTALPLGGAAQEATSIQLTSPYPGIFVEPGGTAGFTVVVMTANEQVLDLAVSGLPEGWDATLRGGGSEISQVTAGPGDDAATIDLDVTIPLDATEDTYSFQVTASNSGGSASLPLEIQVRAGAGGEVTLTPEFPGLRGPADATFSFTVEVENQTAEEVQLELSASGPEGWRVEARPAAENQASTLVVDAGGRQRVTVEARPPITVTSGDYEIIFRATGAGIEEEIPLTVRVTGDVAIEISTTDQRLNATVTAGEPTVIPIVVTNVGTAPLNSIELAGTTPRNWEVTFDPGAIASLAAGESVTANATVIPAADALAGDYRVTFRASVDQAQDSIEIRTTVDPSTMWGLIGVGVIALTLGGLAGVFRRFGRR